MSFWLLQDLRGERSGELVDMVPVRARGDRYRITRDSVTLSSQGMGGRHISPWINMYAVYCRRSPRDKWRKRERVRSREGLERERVKQKYKVGKDSRNRRWEKKGRRRMTRIMVTTRSHACGFPELGNSIWLREMMSVYGCLQVPAKICTDLPAKKIIMLGFINVFWIGGICWLTGRWNFVFI